MSVAGDERGVSESSAVAALIAITVLVTASVGLSVFFVGTNETGDVEANFRYDFSQRQNFLVIVHAGGDKLQAGNVYVQGPANNVTWATLAGMNGTEMIGQNSRVLVSSTNAYGDDVLGDDTIKVVYIPDEGNRTVLKSCSADCSG